jgi:hypothetical protein
MRGCRVRLSRPNSDSCGEPEEKARTNIKDAMRGFLEAAEHKATLDEILEEAGYARVGNEWKAPEFVGLDIA